MSTPSGYGHSSGVPGGDDDGPEALTPEPPMIPEPAPERRSRPIDSGIPAPRLEETTLGPARAFVEEPPPEFEPDPEDLEPRWSVDRGTGFLLVVLGTAVILLFVASQAAGFLTALAAWPPIVQAVGYGVVAVLGVMIAVSMIGLGWAYMRLPLSPRLRVARADTLNQRRSVQIQARKDRAIARKRLGEFLDRYPLDAPRHRRFLASIAGRDRVDALKLQRDWLRSNDPGTDDDWVREFEARFLRPLDELARSLVKRHAVAVGWKTAIVPSGLLDGMIVIANAYALIGSLCRVYSLRADAWSTLKIMIHVFGNTFVAARLEEFTDQAADASFEHMQDLINSQLARGVLSRLSSGVTQGTVNGLLLRRFGRFAVRALRPIRGS